MKFTAGIDIGSLTCDAVVIDEEGQVLASEIVPTGARIWASIERTLDAVLQKTGLEREDLAALVSTGYGRDSVECRTGSVTEISCHARGAEHLLPGTRLVLDVGGQDTKAILLDGKGAILDFAMNDKCAAGTGRFFEVMARALEIDLDDVGTLACRASKRISISSVCTVFAESEVISLVSHGESAENILAGLCWAAAERVKKLAQQVGITEPVTLTGGGARNIGLSKALEELLGVEIRIPEEPQIVGALGAALIGMADLTDYAPLRVETGIR